MNVSLTMIEHEKLKYLNIDEVGEEVFNGKMGFKNDIIEYQRNKKKHLLFLTDEDDNEWLDGKSMLSLTKWIQKDNSTTKITGFIRFLKQQGIYSTKRKISQTVWKEIGFRQKWLCNICNTMLKATFELDHIIELEQQGEDTIENLQALCAECHAQKTHGFRLKKRKKQNPTYQDEKQVFSKYFKR